MTSRIRFTSIDACIRLIEEMGYSVDGLGNDEIVALAEELELGDLDCGCMDSQASHWGEDTSDLI